MPKYVLILAISPDAGDAVTAVLLVLSAQVFCGLLRCVAQSDDLSRRHHGWVLDTLDMFKEP